MTEVQSKRVLVLGARGMAGHMVTSYLDEAGHSVVRAFRGVGSESSQEVSIDVNDDHALSELVTNGGYDAVINCVGVLVARSAERPEEAIRLNALLPHRLESLTSGGPTRVIHLSTDCVFSGKTGPYVESSFRDGDSLYDRAKALGELNNAKDLTLRMSIIGPEIREAGGGLMHWFLNQTGSVRGFSRAIWNGVTTLELAKAVHSILDTDLAGIYQLVPDYSISKHDLLSLISVSFGRRDLTLLPDSSVESDKTLIDTRKTSPYVVGAGGYAVMVDELRDWIVGHPRLYGGQPCYRAYSSGDWRGQ